MKFNYSSNIQLEHCKGSSLLVMIAKHLDRDEEDQRNHLNENIDKSKSYLNSNNLDFAKVKREFQKMKTCSNYQKKSTPFTMVEISLSIIKDNECSKFGNWENYIRQNTKGLIHSSKKQNQAIKQFLSDSEKWVDKMVEGLVQEFGPRLVGYEVHRDEVNIHIHAIVQNYDQASHKIDRRFFYTRDKLSQIQKTMFLKNQEFVNLQGLNNSFSLNNERNQKGEFIGQTKRKRQNINDYKNNKDFEIKQESKKTQLIDLKQKIEVLAETKSQEKIKTKINELEVAKNQYMQSKRNCELEKDSLVWKQKLSESSEKRLKKITNWLDETNPNWRNEFEKFQEEQKMKNEQKQSSGQRR